MAAPLLPRRSVIVPEKLYSAIARSMKDAKDSRTSSERARDMKSAPIYIWGFGEGHTRGPLESDTLTTLGGKQASAVAYKMAGVGPKYIDFAEIYDYFTAITIVTLEDYGFCAKGEGGPWVKTGASRSAENCL